MIETYPVDIEVGSLEVKLTEDLKSHGFQRLYLGDLHYLDRTYLEHRDRREGPIAPPLTPFERRSRSDDDFLLYNNPEGTLAYVRPCPRSPRDYHTLGFEIHFRTAVERGFSPKQYFSLAIPDRNLKLLTNALQPEGDKSIYYICNFEILGRLNRIYDQLDVVEGDNLPVHLFHSISLGRKREEKGGYSNKEKAIEELSRAIGSIIISAHLFSRKQIAYYKAAAEVDPLFSESALVG